jgi:hypothetical protein
MKSLSRGHWCCSWSGIAHECEVGVWLTMCTGNCLSKSKLEVASVLVRFNRRSFWAVSPLFSVGSVWLATGRYGQSILTCTSMRPVTSSTAADKEMGSRLATVRVGSLLCWLFEKVGDHSLTSCLHLRETQRWELTSDAMELGAMSV